MIAIALVLMVTAGAYAQLPTNCGQTPIQPDLSQRIVGGKEAVRHSWPWQISLRYGGQHICGGSIIHGSYIVTAAHCTYGLNPSSFSIRAGRHTTYGTEANEQIGAPSRMWQHESYNDDTVNNDITLFRISTAFRFNNFVQPVCLASSEITTSDTSMYATGWGDVQGTCCEGRLKQVRLPSRTRSYCRQYYGSGFTNAMICAGYPSGESTCMGDSGGPLVTKVNGKWELHGATSFGRSRVCSEGGPVVFTNIHHFDSWIRTKITAVEAEEAEFAARGVRLVPYGAAFRQQVALSEDVGGVEVVPV